MTAFAHTLKVLVTAKNDQAREEHARTLELTITNLTGGLTRYEGVGYWAPTDEREPVTILEAWLTAETWQPVLEALDPALRFYLQAAEQQAAAVVFDGQPFVFSLEELDEFVTALVLFGSKNTLPTI